MASYRVSTNVNSSNVTAQDKANKKQQKTRKTDQLRLFTRKHEILKIIAHLQTAFAEETHLAERQWAKEQLNMVKLRMFRSNDTQTDSFEGRGATFRGTTNNY
jgi:hypothetical protein